MLGTVRIPLYIKVEGHHIPFMVTVLATSTGPLVEADKESGIINPRSSEKVIVSL